MAGKKSRNTFRVNPPINSEVCVEGFEEEIGTGIVQGIYKGVTHLEQPIVRFNLTDISGKGERYLRSHVCLTSGAKRSSLYVIDKSELLEV
jgi:hypothetical protein